MLERVLSGTYGKATYMTCGPQAIMDLVVEHLRRHEVPEAHVKTESFES
jgi:ferredoxin-NADP reductase